MYKSLLKYLILFLLTVTELFAQNSNMNFQVFGLGSIPVDEFNKKIGSSIEITKKNGFDYGSNVGLAKFGYGIGVELSIPVLVSGLAWQFSTLYLLNSTDNSQITYEFNNDEKIIEKLEFEIGNWSNLPFTTGFSYGLNLISKINIYLHLQAGINYSSQPDRKVFYDDILVESVKYNDLIDFAFQPGISIDYNEFYSISFRYLNLNSPRFEGKRYINELLFPEISTRDYKIAAEEKSIEMFLITLGIKL
jgi:hypothetical protein